jgi:hypothetical protein
MLDILKRGKEKFGVVSVKAEFEAEGTRIDELLRLIDIAGNCSLPLTVKIGGCEAIRDLLEAKQIGVKYVVAPMIESGYAASKYRDAKDLIFTDVEQERTKFLMNIETIQGFNNLEELISESKKGKGLSGLVFGRRDFVGSLGLPTTSINDEMTTEYVLKVAAACASNNLELVIGGGMSVESLGAIKRIKEIRLDRFESRKVIFGASQALDTDIEQGLYEAVQFEYLWLVNKHNYYKAISEEDQKRIESFDTRLKQLAGWLKERK